MVGSFFSKLYGPQIVNCRGNNPPLFMAAFTSKVNSANSVCDVVTFVAYSMLIVEGASEIVTSLQSAGWHASGGARVYVVEPRACK